jgi:biopolymer transport protein ExbD
MQASSDSVDINLTPMLDLVMQLLMYFIMCVQFVGQEVNENVKLPESQVAMPIDKSEADFLYLNIDKDGKILVLGQPPMDMADTTAWLNARVREAPKDKNDKPTTAIVIRADKNVGYGNVFDLMDTCKAKGFSRFFVRANKIQEKKETP